MDDTLPSIRQADHWHVFMRSKVRWQVSVVRALLNLRSERTSSRAPVQNQKKKKKKRRRPESPDNKSVIMVLNVHRNHKVY